MNYSSINIQGNIISSEILEKIRTEDIRFQKAIDFNLNPNTPVRDEINLAWSLALSHWKAFKIKRDNLADTESGTAETRKYWILPLLGILGYEVNAANAEIINNKSYAISHRVSNKGAFPIHVVGVNQSLDKKAESGGTRLSPHALVQEYVNNTEHLYGLVCNGKFLRLLRDATRLSRLSYLEFNLEHMMEEGLYIEFALLYRLLHSTRVPSHIDQGAESILEFYHQEAIASGTRIRERLSIAVEQSIKALANGFLQSPENEFLREDIAANKLSPKNYYLYTLRLVYRMLFLLVIEERKLIYKEKLTTEEQKQRDIYYNFYSVQRLTKLAQKLVYVDAKKTDLWLSLKSTFALFEQGRYGNLLGIAPLGAGLFSEDALGLLKDQALNNDCLLKVIRYLVTFENENGQQVRVNYADLDVEEFGSVYEGLLEYDPAFNDASGQPIFSFVKGSARSSSGSHYTPEELVKPLIKHSLDYLIADKLKEKDPENALLSLSICDVACGSGHILLSAARRVGFELAKLRSNEEQPTPSVLRLAVRDVIKNCIYGVDKNPLAIELCKVALWLEAHNPGEPLNFLDHHIKCGDAIVGLAHREELENGIANEAFKTLVGDDKIIAGNFLKRNKEERKAAEDKAAGQQLKTEAQLENTVHEAMEEYKVFTKLPERTPDEITRKAKMYAAFIEGKGYGFLKAMADTQVAQFFIPKIETQQEYLMTDADYRLILSGYKGWQERRVAIASEVAIRQRFFHWFVEFPQVFNEGGFDCILGNPPYLGGAKISGANGSEFLNYLYKSYEGLGGQADLVAYFFRRIFNLISNKGFMALISSNTISQGDTREGGLKIIDKEGGKICFAIRSKTWPGQASVKVSLLSITKQDKVTCYLDNKKINNISYYLDEEQTIFEPLELKINQNKGFIGTALHGIGFSLDFKEGDNLINSSANLKDVIKLYLNGKDLNNHPSQEASRYVIDVSNLSIEQVLEKYSKIYEILLDKVKPDREKNNRQSYMENWWVFGEKRPLLYSKIARMDRVLLRTQASKHNSFVFHHNDNLIFDQKVIVFSIQTNIEFSLLSSSLHENWFWRFKSDIGETPNYSPSGIFQTFPFPQNLTPFQELQLETIGEAYHEERRQLMLDIQYGLTKTYNLFHSNGITKEIINTKDKQVAALQKHIEKMPNTISFEDATHGILKLRELHVQMDEAVLDAYAWNDIKLHHDFYEVDYLPENDRVRYTIHPDARKEILKRLLALNHTIYEEEIKQGLHKEEDVKKFYEQKGQAIPAEVQAILASNKKDKKTKAYKSTKAKNESVQEMEASYKPPELFGEEDFSSGEK
jgi:methylase of polypeptide subunit release factors